MSAAMHIMHQQRLACFMANMCFKYLTVWQMVSKILADKCFREPTCMPNVLESLWQVLLSRASQLGCIVDQASHMIRMWCTLQQVCIDQRFSNSSRLQHVLGVNQSSLPVSAET